MKNEVGRALFDGKNEKGVIQKLEEVFAMGGTDIEACFYAGISKSAFYEWQKKNEWFLERKEALKVNPILKARRTIIESLNNPVYAKWYLERRLKEEFNMRFECLSNQKVIIDEISEEERKKIDAMILSLANK